MKIKKSTSAATKTPAPVKAKAVVAKTKTVTVPVPEPTPAPVAKAKTKAAPAGGEVTLARNLSLTTFPSDHPFFPGRKARIMEFQDFTFAQHAAAPETARLTDVQLAELWSKEFPRAVAFNERHVAGARRDFLANRHSKTFAALTAEAAIATLTARASNKKKVAA